MSPSIPNRLCFRGLAAERRATHPCNYLLVPRCAVPIPVPSRGAATLSLCRNGFPRAPLRWKSPLSPFSRAPGLRRRIGLVAVGGFRRLARADCNSHDDGFGNAELDGEPARHVVQRFRVGAPGCLPTAHPGPQRPPHVFVERVHFIQIDGARRKRQTGGFSSTRLSEKQTAARMRPCS
jgi:hypothetical protein